MGDPSGASPARRPRAPAPFQRPAAGAAAVGFLVGVSAVGLVALAMRACDALRDSPSCGGPGVVMLIAIVVALATLGAVLLTYARVPQPAMVSLLGVTVAVVAMLAGFVEQPFSTRMGLVAPVLAACSFALCHLVLSTAAEPDPDDE